MTSSRAIWFQVIDYGKKSWNMKVGLVHEVASWNFCLKNKNQFGQHKSRS